MIVFLLKDIFIGKTTWGLPEAVASLSSCDSAEECLAAHPEIIRDMSEGADALARANIKAVVSAGFKAGSQDTPPLDKILIESIDLVQRGSRTIIERTGGLEPVGVSMTATLACAYRCGVAAVRGGCPIAPMLEQSQA